MPSIVHELVVKAPPDRVFRAMATPEGLDRWWTKTSQGKPQEGAEYGLFFGPEFDWQGKVTRYQPHSTFELQMTKAHPDWIGTRVGCELHAEGTGNTRVLFYHTGWPTENEHWRVSCFCWAMYLRVMRRNLEYGDTVPYENRLDV
jgi:uncharacterized protein YndB with AHSA1/START domain